MYEFAYEDQLSVEAIVARRMGDEDWEELVSYDPLGCSRRATSEAQRDRFEPEPVTIKDLRIPTGHHRRRF